METIEQAKDQTIFGLVIYTDAGARPNPGFGGRGMHGYFYEIKKENKICTAKNHIVTDRGYILKNILEEGSFRANAVTPVSYVDGFGTFSYMITNIAGELTSAMCGLKLAEANLFPISKVTIITDSEYVVKGTNEYLDIWRTNRWFKRDGNPVANKDIWIEFSALLDSIRAKGIIVNLEWIEAHCGYMGNTEADKLATSAVMRSKDGVSLNETIITKEIAGYWKTNVEKHPFIANKWMYFNTLAEYIIPGQYYLSEHGKDEDTPGSKQSDGSYSFIVLNTPDPILELVRDVQSNAAEDNDSLIISRLDYIFNAGTYQDFLTHGKYAFCKSNPYKLDLTGLDGEPITRELRPPKLAFRAIEALTDLSLRLDEFLSGDPKYTVTDLNEYFYEIKEVKKKKDIVLQKRIKPSIPVGITHIDINAKYNIDDVVNEANLKLCFGIDLPTRNAFKNMEDLNPDVRLITWKESNLSFRYATIITVDDAKGIWAGVYSNLRIVLN